MLRGLVVRQGFMIAEGLLGLTIIGIAIAALADLYAPSVSKGREVAKIDPASLVALESPVDARADYDTIISSKIFGAAAAYVHNAPPAAKVEPPKPVDPVVTDTKLPLVLKGTLVTGETSPFSSANIQVNEKGIGLQTFFIGSEIIENVFLLKVNKNEVLLDNKRSNRQEILKHEVDLQARADSARDHLAPPNVPEVLASRPGASGRPEQQQLITLDRKAISDKMNEAYESMASTIDVLEVKDDDGNLLGLTTPDMESISVLNELGFKNGDVLVSVNNERVTSQDQMAELANKYQNSNVVRVGILREGQPMNFTYRLR